MTTRHSAQDQVLAPSTRSGYPPASSRMNDTHEDRSPRFESNGIGLVQNPMPHTVRHTPLPLRLRNSARALPSRNSSKTTKHTTSEGTEKSPLFKLPPELRDTIYDMVAADEPILRLRIDVRQDLKGRYAQAQAYTITGLARACRLLRLEYGIALERRIKLLRTPKGDRYGLRLMEYSRLQTWYGWEGLAEDRKRIYLSRSDEATKTHALAVTISLVADQILLVRKEDFRSGVIYGVPVVADRESIARKDDTTYVIHCHGRMQTGKRLVVMFVTDGSQRLTQQFSLMLPQLGPDESELEVGLTALEEVKRGMRAIQWRSSVQYHALWYSYVIRAPRMDQSMQVE